MSELIPLKRAQDIAAATIDDLLPYVARIQVAGSVRRKKPLVKDVELVCISKALDPETDLFGNPLPVESDALTRYLGESDAWAKRLSKIGVPAFGRRNKLMLYKGVPVDIFQCTPSEWGWVLMYRTGPREWNITAATRLRWLGYHGRITGGIEDGHGNRLETLTEADVFKLLVWEEVKPEDRR